MNVKLIAVSVIYDFKVRAFYFSQSNFTYVKVNLRSMFCIKISSFRVKIINNYLNMFKSNNSYDVVKILYIILYLLNTKY